MLIIVLINLFDFSIFCIRAIAMPFTVLKCVNKDIIITYLS